MCHPRRQAILDRDQGPKKGALLLGPEAPPTTRTRVATRPSLRGDRSSARGGVAPCRRAHVLPSTLGACRPRRCGCRVSQPSGARYRHPRTDDLVHPEQRSLPLQTLIRRRVAAQPPYKCVQARLVVGFARHRHAPRPSLPERVARADRAADRSRTGAAVIDRGAGPLQARFETGIRAQGVVRRAPRDGL